MEYVRYLFRFLYKSIWWLILGTFIVTFTVIYMTRNMRGNYRVQATLYTGIVSGYTIEDNGSKMDWSETQNAMDNLINIIKAESTLKRVSYRLFAHILIYGDPKNNVNHITSSSYNMVYNHVKNSPDGKHILSLIDKSSEEKTIKNLIEYTQPDKTNYVYGLFYYNHPFFSYNALRNINVFRKGNSDLLDISYESSDPGVAYFTIEFLTREFVNEYKTIRYGETDKVIAYFKSELERIGKELRENEDDLTEYNVEKRIINYVDETKEIASINKEYELREQDVLFAYNSSKAMLQELERQMDSNTKQALNNVRLIDKLKEASSLTGKITELETINSDQTEGQNSLQQYKNRLEKARKELSTISNNYIAQQYTKEGMTKKSILEQWLDQTLLFEKAKAELEIIRESRLELNDKYAFYAPVGSTIKRKERVINFTERNYLTILQSYNEALIRRKNLEMTSASLRVLNEPAYPISTEQSSRKKLVLASFLGSFVFILGFLLLIELFDRTLRDPIRTFRLTGCKVLGAYPNSVLSLNAQVNKERKLIAANFLSISVLRFFTNHNPDLPYIINLLSTSEETGKSHLAVLLETIWQEKGLKVRHLSWDKDFNPNSRDYSLATSLNDLYQKGDEDILIVEHPTLNRTNIPNALLHEANLNLLIVSAIVGWKDTDHILLEKLKSQIGDTPLYIYLNHSTSTVVERFTGMLPPYTLRRRIFYKISQLALTEKMSFNIRPSKKSAKNK